MLPVVFGHKFTQFAVSSSRLVMVSSNRNRVVAAVALASSNSYVAAFSTIFTATSAITSLLKDPTLLGNDNSNSNASSTNVDTLNTFDVVDPGASTRQVNDGSVIIAKIRRMGRTDTKQAIDRASTALVGWKDGTTALQRSGILTKWSSLIKENTEDIAKIMTLESGKPLHESRGEVAYGASFLDWFAAEAIRYVCCMIYINLLWLGMLYDIYLLWWFDYLHNAYHQCSHTATLLSKY